MNSSKSKGVEAPLRSPSTRAARRTSTFMALGFFGMSVSTYLPMHEYQTAATMASAAVHFPTNMVVP
jgi:hypothetical protein